MLKPQVSVMTVCFEQLFMNVQVERDAKNKILIQLTDWYLSGTN